MRTDKGTSFYPFIAESQLNSEHYIYRENIVPGVPRIREFQEELQILFEIHVRTRGAGMDFYTDNAANKAENFKIQPCCWPVCYVPAHLRIVRFNID